MLIFGQILNILTLIWATRVTVVTVDSIARLARFARTASVCRHGGVTRHLCTQFSCAPAGAASPPLPAAVATGPGRRGAVVGSSEPLIATTAGSVARAACSAGIVGLCCCGGVTGYISTVLPRVPFAFASPLAPVNAPIGLGMRQAVIDCDHDHPTAVITRSTASRVGFSRVLISQSAGLVIVIPDHFPTLASCRRSHGMRKAPVVAGCLRLGLSVHVKMKNRLHRDKVATCSPDYTYG